MNYHFNIEAPQKLLDFFVSKKFVKFSGLAFLIIGLIMAFMSIKMHIDEKDALTWTPHVAQIQSAKIRTHIDSDNGFKSYSIDVRYRYKWGNVFFRGDQYRLHDDASPGFDKNNEIVQNLLYAKQHGEAFPIFVNPNNPAVSSIKNEVNWEAKIATTILGILFTIVGFFAFFFPNLFNRKTS